MPKTEETLPANPSSHLQQAFSALDAGSLREGEIGRWMHAGKTSAEAGFDDPTMGWVGVRAELGASGIHATVVSGSADGAQTLTAHLPELNAYLHEHRTGVESLTVATPESQWSNQAMDQERQQARDDTRRGSTGDQRSPGRDEDAGNGALRSQSVTGVAAADRIASLSASGGYISVMA